MLILAFVSQVHKRHFFSTPRFVFTNLFTIRNYFFLAVEGEHLLTGTSGWVALVLAAAMAAFGGEIFTFLLNFDVTVLNCLHINCRFEAT